MIPKNITRKHILGALKKIDREGVPMCRDASKFHIVNDNKTYPPKYTISLANKIANRVELKPNEFSGGDETNEFLRKLGFNIVKPSGVEKNPAKQPVPQPVSPPVHDSSVGMPETLVPSLPVKDDPPLQYKDEPNSQYKLATVCVESESSVEGSLEQRLELLKNVIVKFSKNVDLFVFPAGFFHTGGKYEKVSEQIESGVCDAIRQSSSSVIVCVGVDALSQKDQLAVVLNKEGILSMARKFFPADGESGRINLARDPLVGEGKYPRIFPVKGKSVYPAVCYDSFGIRKKSVKRPKIDLIVNLIHGFNPKGEFGSGDVFFAKYGMAGSSKEWGCPTYAAAVFSRCNIPPNWPTGVMWNQGDKSTQNWKYIENALIQPESFIITSSNPNESAIIRIFNSH